MRKLLLLWLVVKNCSGLFCQSIASSSISSTGGSVSNNGIQLIWSVGQSSLITYESDDEGTGCRQGFIQPIYSSKLKNEGLSKYIFEIYPNPASDYLRIRKLSEEEETYSLQFSNSIGSYVWEQKLTNQKVTEIDISNLKDGLYLLKLHGVNSIFSYKIIILKKWKLNQ